MKILKSTAVILSVAVFMMLRAFAAEYSFRVFSEDEAKYIYEEIGSNQADWVDGGRFNDATVYITYEFALDKGDNTASISLHIGAQYAIWAASANPNKESSFTLIYYNEKSDEEIASGADNWYGTKLSDEPVTIDLSAFCEKNRSGKIWVKIGDIDDVNGWGGFIYTDYPVVFKSAHVDENGNPVPYVPTESVPQSLLTASPSADETISSSGAKVWLIAAGSLLAAACILFAAYAVKARNAELYGGELVHKPSRFPKVK